MKQKQRRGNPLLPFLPNSIFSVHIFPSLHSINQTKPNQTNSLLFFPIHPKILTTTTTIKTNNTPKAKKKRKKKERNNATAIVHGDIVGNGIDFGATIQDPIEEASDNGPGSRQAWSWANHGQDRWCHRLCGALVQRLQHDQDPEALDR